MNDQLLDEPFVLGRRPRAAAPFPFTPVQYARLLVLRGRVQDGLVAEDDQQPRYTLGLARFHRGEDAA